MYNFYNAINLSENDKNSVLETVELKEFLGEHAPKPPVGISRQRRSFCPPPVSSPRRRHSSQRALVLDVITFSA